MLIESAQKKLRLCDDPGEPLTHDVCGNKIQNINNSPIKIFEDLEAMRLRCAVLLLAIFLC